MSNQAVGNVYQSVIDEVINSSRVDFEENGVEEAVLEELRLGWQTKLTQLDVARFPWDPKPVEPTPPPPAAAPQQPQPPAVHNAAATHSQAQFSPQLPIPNVAMPQASHNGIKQEPQHASYDEPQIKQEPGVAPNYNTSGNVAAARAQQHLNAMYGQRAAGSINALSGGHQPQQQQQQQQQQQRPQVPQVPQQQPQAPQTAQKAPPPAHPTPALSQEQLYRQQMAAQMAQQQQRSAHLNKNQTDGAGDDEGQDDDSVDAVLMRRGAAGQLEELGRVDIDNLLHRQIAARAKAMEGGGLMVPLKQATRHSSKAPLGESSGSAARTRGVAAHDGGDDDDDDEADEDAINSDLDDPEDEEAEDDDADEGMGSIMLCMYDKVQRVKNKWKCTLKDGVLTVNGQDYVFHKATGEFEW